jgi:hypothetical protein
MNEQQEESRALVPIKVEPPVTMLPTMSEIQIMGTLARSVIGARGHAVPASIDSPAKAFAVMLAGFEMGARPMTALRHIFVINGRTEPDAQLMMGIVKARDPSAQFVFHSRAEDLCDVELFRGGRPVVRLAYTAADAERAGLLKKGGPWTQYRKDMMAWAAVKRVCRLGASDLINAISGVDVGEAEDMMGESPEEGGPVVEVQVVPAGELLNEGDEPVVVDAETGEILEPTEETAEPEPEPEAPPSEPDLPQLRNLGDLYNAAIKRLGYKDKGTVLATLECPESQIADLPAAWRKLVAKAQA